MSEVLPEAPDVRPGCRAGAGLDLIPEPSAPMVVLAGRSLLLRTHTEVLGEHAAWYLARIGAGGPPWRKVDPPRSARISRSGGRCVWRLQPGPGGEPGTILKVERPAIPGILRRLIRRSGAEREFRNLRALRALGFPAVEPIAHGSQGLGPLRLGTFLVTRDFEGSVSLRQWTRAAQQPIPRGEIERLLLAMAPALASLHRGGGAIRTLLAKNILVRERPGRAAELALCDVPRFLSPRDGPPAAGQPRFRHMVRDLATLDKWASVTFDGSVRREFLRTYIAALGPLPMPRRELIHRIIRAVDRMEHRTFMGRLSLGIKTALRRLHLEQFWPF